MSKHIIDADKKMEVSQVSAFNPNDRQTFKQKVNIFEPQFKNYEQMNPF